MYVSIYTGQTCTYIFTIYSPKTPKVMSPEPAEKEKGQLDAAMPKSERKEAIMRRMEQMEKEQGKREKEKMTEEEVKQMVENVEGKCKTVKSDMADMAMTEQYLRTKQALLMAKKKEQEMKVAANIAAIREQEVQKMRDKVKCMQVFVGMQFGSHLMLFLSGSTRLQKAKTQDHRGDPS